jgi:hypothetical protein
MLILLAVVIAVAMAGYVIFPLLSPETAGGPLPTDVTLISDLKRRRLVVYDNLQDLDFEFQSGKIAREDYESLRTNYMGEAAGLMAATQEAELLKQDDAVVEREIAARRVQRRSLPKVEYKCAACGYENPLPVKFCGECGKKIAVPGKKHAS